MRHPHVLVPLIQKALDETEAIRQRAASAYYTAAGFKLLEAKAQFQYPGGEDEFYAWARRNIRISKQEADRFMGYARAYAAANEAKA